MAFYIYIYFMVKYYLIVLGINKMLAVECALSEGKRPPSFSSCY